MLAAKQEQHGFIKLLLKGNARLNIQDANGRTALMIALREKRMKNALVLVQAGTKLKIWDKHGNTALMYAVAAGFLEVAKK